MNAVWMLLKPQLKADWTAVSPEGSIRSDILRDSKPVFPMNKLIFTNKAVDDLSSIWEYTVRTWSVSQAERYYNLLIDCCRMISESKITTSRRYDEVMAGLSGVRAGRHIIFYTISDSHCATIVRILHEKMDIRQRLKE